MSGSQPSRRDNFFFDHINIFAYYQKSNQIIAAINLLFNGYQILQGATIVKDFDIYRNIQYTEDHPPQHEIITPFINDSLMDDTRIVTCFENYMKAILILNDYVAHKITHKLRSLKFEQRDRPISKSEIFQESSFTSFDPLRPEQWETNHQTLNFSWMLKPKYQAIINLPAEIISFISAINEERNKLHFISAATFSFGNPTIERYQKIIEFADTTIKKSIVDLDISMKTIVENLKPR